MRWIMGMVDYGEACVFLDVHADEGGAALLRPGTCVLLGRS